MRRFSRAAGSELHQRIAESLRDRFPERAEREPGIVAHHFTQAGLRRPQSNGGAAPAPGRCTASPTMRLL